MGQPGHNTEHIENVLNGPYAMLLSPGALVLSSNWDLGTSYWGLSMC